jgi:hypothetical protein
MAPVPLPVKPIATMPDRLHHQTRPVIIEFARDRSAKRNQSDPSGDWNET